MIKVYLFQFTRFRDFNKDIVIDECNYCIDDLGFLPYFEVRENINNWKFIKNYLPNLMEMVKTYYLCEDENIMVVVDGKDLKGKFKRTYLRFKKEDDYNICYRVDCTEPIKFTKVQKYGSKY